MAEEVLFETERSLTREEISTYLRQVADSLEGEGPLSLRSGDDSVDLEIPDRATFEVKAERETEGEETELSVEFELEWDEGGSDDGSDADELRID